MGHVEVAHVSHVLPDGRTLLDDASFKIGEGITAALVGPNGAGKTTLLRLIAGDAQPQSGVITATGTLGVMRQFIGGPAAAGLTVRDLLLSVAPQRVRDAAGQLDDAELAMMERDDEPAQLGYAKALNDYAEAGGYDAEVHWDECCVAALGTPYDLSRWRAVSTLSGGQQKRLVLESLLRGAQGTLLLDEPDNYLDVGGKRWLENQLATTTKTVLLVSHDRELLNACAQRIVTVEDGKTWVHGGGFATYDQARRDRIERLEELRRRWDEEQAKLRDLVRMYRQKASYNSDMASRLQAAVTRLEKFEAAGPPELPPREQHIKVRLKGGRTGRRAVMCEGLAVAGTTRPFDAEIWYGDRIAILGANGSGKSSFLRLLAGEPLAHEGTWKLGARVVPGMFAQTHARPDLEGRAPAEILISEHAMAINEAMAALARYELHKCARQPFGTLSGGQQARLQILLLELGGATLLLLDEPTDNLDLPSADALQAGLEAYQGTVLAVTHDRWFARSLDSCLVFGSDGAVRASAEPVWDLSEFSERTRCDSPGYRILYRVCYPVEGETMSVRHALLALLSEGPKYGLQLREEFEARTGEVWPLNVGQVYTTLQRLERDGLVEAAGTAGTPGAPGAPGAPAEADGDEGTPDLHDALASAPGAPQKAYRITEAGSAELAQWLRVPPDLSSPPRDELVMKVLVAVTVPGTDVHEVIQAHRTYLVQLMQEWTRLKEDDNGSDVAFALVVDAELFRLDSVVRWLDAADGRLRRAAADGWTQAAQARAAMPALARRRRMGATR